MPAVIKPNSKVLRRTTVLLALAACAASPSTSLAAPISTNAFVSLAAVPFRSVAPVRAHVSTTHEAKKKPKKKAKKVRCVQPRRTAHHSSRAVAAATRASSGHKAKSHKKKAKKLPVCNPKPKPKPKPPVKTPPPTTTTPQPPVTTPAGPPVTTPVPPMTTTTGTTTTPPTTTSTTTTTTPTTTTPPTTTTTPPPDGPLPNVPDGFQLVDLIHDNGFESGVDAFEVNAPDEGTVATTTSNPISGAQSLHVTVQGYGRVGLFNDYAYGAGPIADSVTVKAKIRVEGNTASQPLQICAIAYAQGNPTQTCQSFPVDAQHAADVFLTLDTGQQQIERAFFQLRLPESGTVSATIDDAHLYVVQKPGGGGTGGGGGGTGGGGGGGGGSSGDLEQVGFADHPTNYRSMTAEMNLGNDLSASGAAANAQAKDVGVTLYPAADSLGTRRVSFGFPLAPGALLSTANVKVTDATTGQEIPAFVRSLGAWTHIPAQNLLCGGLQASGNPGIRSVLIQFDHAFTSTSPVQVTVGINRARAQSLTTEVPVRNTYRVVNDGTYDPAVSHGVTVHEPAVLAAVDHSYLACSSLVPMVDTAGSRAYMAKSDQATDDFFYSVINEAYPFKQSWPVTDLVHDLADFYTADSVDEWLYDRAQTFYNGYIRTGDVTMLREANRASDHYNQNIYGPQDCPTAPSPYCVGIFKLKAESESKTPDDPYPDTKYSYNENLFTDYELNGDPTVLKTIGYVSYAQEFHVGNSVTERHLAFALLSHAVDYELTGDAHQLADTQGLIQTMRTRQTSPLDGNPPNGCFNYAPEGQADTFSPWMSSLLAWAFLRSYQATGNALVPPALTDLGQCEVTQGIAKLPSASDDPPMHANDYYPFYIAASFGAPDDVDTTSIDPTNGFEHSLDVAVPVALGAFFTTNSTQKAALTTVAKGLLTTHGESIDYWTRNSTGRTKYRISPARKFNWQYKNAGSVGWALDGPPHY